LIRESDKKVDPEMDDERRVYYKSQDRQAALPRNWSDTQVGGRQKKQLAPTAFAHGIEPPSNDTETAMQNCCASTQAIAAFWRSAWNKLQRSLPRVRRAEEDVPVRSLTFFETSAAIIGENATIHHEVFHIEAQQSSCELVISLRQSERWRCGVFPLPRGVAYEAAKTPGTAWQIYVF